MLGEAARIDEEEDRKFGRGQSADALPAELAHAESRLDRIRQAKRELEEEAQQKLKAAEQEREANRRPPGRPRKDAPQQPSERNRIKKSLKRARQNEAQPKRHYNSPIPIHA